MRCAVLLTMCLCVIAPISAQDKVVNLAINPSFEDENDVVDGEWVDGWLFWGDGNGLQSTVEFDAAEFIDGTRSLKVIPAEAEFNWQFMVINWPVPLNVGSDYTVSLWAKAEAPRPITAHFKASDNSTSWGQEIYQLTTEWAEYTTTAEALNGTLKYEIFALDSQDVFWLDFVSIYEGDYVPDILPSEFGGLSVEPSGKLVSRWAALKAL